MNHFLKSADGAFELDIEMGCNHPDMVDNSTAGIGCDGDCASCAYSVAKCSIPVMMELLQRADCNQL